MFFDQNRSNATKTIWNGLNLILVENAKIIAFSYASSNFITVFETETSHIIQKLHRSAEINLKGYLKTTKNTQKKK